VELSYLKFLADVESEVNSETVTDQHIEEQLVPPTFLEILQKMRESYLSEFPSDTEQP
jgi:hypothetical protein